MATDFAGFRRVRIIALVPTPFPPSQFKQPFLESAPEVVNDLLHGKIQHRFRAYGPVPHLVPIETSTLPSGRGGTPSSDPILADSKAPSFLRYQRAPAITADTQRLYHKNTKSRNIFQQKTTVVDTSDRAKSQNTRSTGTNASPSRLCHACASRMIDTDIVGEYCAQCFTSQCRLIFHC
jgi:hypothetical protein